MVKDLFLSTFRVSYPPNAVDNCAQLWTRIPRAPSVTPKNLRFLPEAQSGVAAEQSKNQALLLRADVPKLKDPPLKPPAATPTVAWTSPNPADVHEESSRKKD